MRTTRSRVALTVLGMLAASPAIASFHLMQVEQVIGGVGNDVGAQAIQLRMRAGLQNQLQLARIRAWDATGANPVLIVDMNSPVVNSAAGSRVLIGTAALQARLSPAIPLDFTMANPIPASYLAAGSLTFESDAGIIYWRLSWGGSGYTGSGAGDVTNDADGNFNPPFASALPFSGTQAVRFRFAASALSTNNANDYLLTAGAAVFTNNAGAGGTVTPYPACTIVNGIDLFTTPAGGTSFTDFSSSPIPAGFFGPGSDPFPGTVVLGGRPIAPLSPLGPTDTVVRRKANAAIPGPGSGATVPIEIVALSLVSTNPITVTYSGVNPELWDMRVCLSSAAAQPTGSMTISASACGCSEGGTFTSILPVLPQFTFTRQSDAAVRVIDYGAPPIPPVQFSAAGHYLTVNPGTFGLITVGPGSSVDHDCSAGTPPVKDLPPTTNFFAGMRGVRCDSGSCIGPLTLEKRMTQEQAAQAAHGVLPAQTCLSGDLDLDGVCDDGDNCVGRANADQRDRDDDGVGDTCDNCALVFNPCQEDTNSNGIGDRCENTGVGDAPGAARVMLSRPAPNPVRGAMRFTVTLPRAARVLVRVYDLRGRLMRTVVDERLEAGSHPFSWSPGASRGAGLASGTYYLRLDADGVRETRAFALIR